MKAKVEATALRGAVSALKRLGMCGPQESLLLDTPHDGTLVVQASAHHIAARINLPAECEETGQIKVNAAELSSLLAAFSGDPVDLEVGDRFVGVSSGERTRGRVRVVEPTSADLWATFDPQEYTTVLEGDFTRALSRVEPFCEKEPTRATHSVVVQNSEAAATNGYVLGVFPVEGKVPSPVQIPHPVAQRMAGLEVDRLAVHQEDGRLAWITGPDMEVLYAQPAGDFPNYQKVLADREGKADLVTLSGDLQEWREAVKRIARIADPVEFMRVGWEKAVLDMVTFTLCSPSDPEGRLSIRVDAEIDETEEAEGFSNLAVNPQFFLAVLGVAGAEFRLGLLGKELPIVARFEESHRAMLMPIRSA